MNDSGMQTILEASHVYVLMKKDYRISRNIRAQWFFRQINHTVQLKKRKNLAECEAELEVISVVPKEPPIDWEPGLSYLYQYKITTSTLVTFLSWKYHLMFCLDIGPSVSVMDLQSGEVMFDEIPVALHKCLDGVTKPFLIPGSGYVFQPELYVTVVAHTPSLKFVSSHVLAQGWRLTSGTLPGFLENIQSQLTEIEENMAEFAQSSSHYTLGSFDEDIDGSRSEPSLSDVFSRALTPDTSFVTLVQYGVLALQLLPENATAGIVIVTNGIIGMPDTNTTESLLNQLRVGAISCSFLQVGSSYHPNCCLGFVPHHDLMHFVSVATQGTYFAQIPQCNKSDSYMNCYHQAFYTWNFQQEGIRNAVGSDKSERSNLDEWTTPNPYFYSSEDVPQLRKRHFKGLICTSLAAVLSCRLREGYVVKDIVFKDNNHLQITFLLQWKHNVRLEYITSCLWPPTSLSLNWQVEVMVEGSYEFLRDFVYPVKRVHQISKTRIQVIKQFRLLLQGLQRTDQLLVHLHSFTANPYHYTIPESIIKRVPLFTGSQNSGNLIPYPNDCTNPMFLSFWKPMCSLDTSIWQKWMHIHRLYLVLEHDHPLPNCLHLPTENGRYQNVQCRQASLALHSFLTAEWSSFILVDNQSYIKFLYSNGDKNPSSFCIIRVSSKTPCMVIRLAFLGGTSGETRNQVITKLKEQILTLTFQQRPVVKDTLVRKGLVSYVVADRSSDSSAPNHTNQKNSSQVSCCVLLTKPLDKLLIRYEKLPTNYFLLIPPQPKSSVNGTSVGAPRSPLGFFKPNNSMNGMNTLFNYLHHHRWIWAVQGANVPSVSSESVARILNALVKIRLNEGFAIAHSHYGMVNLVLEVSMKNPAKMLKDYSSYIKDDTSDHKEDLSDFRHEEEDSDMIDEPYTCLIQYVLFPPHTTYSYRESIVSDEDIDIEVETAEPEGELQVITECWVEPQDGYVCNSRNNALEHLDYKELTRSFFPRDRECISTVVTFEHLSLLSQTSEPVIAAPFLPSPTNHNRPMASSIQHVPFSYDLIEFLPKCHQTELLFSTYIQNPCTENADAPNQLLMELLYENLLTINDREVQLTSQDNRLFPFQVKERQKSDAVKNRLWSPGKTSDEIPSPNSSARTRKISITEPANSIPNWRCFVKALSSTHLILTFVPANFADLKQLALPGRCQYSKLGLSRLNLIQEDTEPNRTATTTTNQNLIPTDIGNVSPSENKSDKQFAAVTLPIYVYDCSLTVLINQLISRDENEKLRDQTVDLTYKTKVETNEDTITLQSETHSREDSKQVSPEPPSEESYISSSSLKLKQHCNNIESVFSKSFVVGIFRSLHQNREIHTCDIQTVVDGICSESLLEIDITNFIQTICSHVRGFRVQTAIQQLNWLNIINMAATDVGNQTENEKDCPVVKVGEDQVILAPKFPVSHLRNGNCQFNELIKNKFSSIIKKSFLPIPSNLDYFFYCLPSFQPSKSRNEFTETGSIDVNEIVHDMIKSELPDIQSERDCTTLPLLRRRSVSGEATIDQDCGNFEMNSQMSVASNVDSESVTSVVADINYCNEETDDVVPPLFVHLMCTVKMKGSVGSCSVRCLPTCLVETLQCLEDNMNELDLSDLHVTLDIICLTLQSEIQSIDKRQNPRTTSFCSVSPLMVENGGFIDESPPDDHFPGEIQPEPRNNIPEFQLQAITKAMEEIKWMLRDEIASAMLDFYPLSEKTLDMVASHVQSSPGRPGCVVEEVPLQFVFGSEQSLDKFIMEFKQMGLTGYKVQREGEFYYMTMNRNLMKRSSDLSPKLHQHMNKFTVVQTTPHADDGMELRKLGKHSTQDSSDDSKPTQLQVEMMVKTERKISPRRSKPSDDTRWNSSLKRRQRRSSNDIQSYDDFYPETAAVSDADVRSLNMYIKKESKDNEETEKRMGDENNSQKFGISTQRRGSGGIPGVFSDDVCSSTGSGQCSTTEEGYDGDSSDIDVEGNDCLSDIDTVRLPKFWLILKVLSDKVYVYFHARDTQESDEELQHWKALYSQVIKNIKNICKIVNQTLLLQDLHDTRMCNQLLEAETSEDIWKVDDYVFVRNKQKFEEILVENNSEYQDSYLKANLDFMPGSFACNVVWQTHFVLHPRLKTGPGRTGVSRGIQALRGVLNSFSVNNRENMFVYSERPGAVFYLRLSESQCPSPCSQMTFLDSSSNAETLPNLSMKKPTTDDEEVYEPRSRMNSITDIPHDTLSMVSKFSIGKQRMEDSIQLLVHGIMEAGPQIKGDLVQVLQNRLDEATLDVIAVTLSRNPMCKLTTEDVQFIQKPNDPPKIVIQFTICAHAQPYLPALNSYLKQNLLQFLHTPKYIDNKPETHFQDYNPNCLETEALKEGEAFLYNRPPDSGNKGIALIALSLVGDREGTPVQHISSSHPMQCDLLEGVSKADFDILTYTELYEPTRNDGPGPWSLIQLRIWERGNINLENLTKRLQNAVRHALWDVVMEYRILMAPLTEGPQIENSSFCSEPVTPVKELRSKSLGGAGWLFPRFPLSSDNKKEALMKKERPSSPLSLVQVKFRELSSSVPDLINKTRSPVASPKEPASAFKLGGSPSSLARDSEVNLTRLDTVDISDRIKLHPIFANHLIDWMQFAITLELPTVWKHSLCLTSRYSVDFVLAELHSLVNNLATDTSLKAFRKVELDGEEIYLPHTISLSVLKPREKRVDHGPDSLNNVQRAPGKTNHFILIGRDIKQWKASLSYLFEEPCSELDKANTHRSDQRFLPILLNNDQPERLESASCPVTASNMVVTPGGASLSGISTPGGSPNGCGTIFIPRQKLLLVTVHDKKIEIYGYNWSLDLMANFKTHTTRLVEWNNSRSRLLSTIVLQKMGLFHETAESKIEMRMEKENLKANDMDLFKLTSPPNRENPPTFPPRRPSASHTNLNFTNIYRDTQPTRPLHKTAYHHIKDPVLKHSQQVQEMRNTEKREQQKKLSNLFQTSPTHSNASLKEESLQLLKTSARIEHYCLTPILFLPQWRLKVACARDPSLPTFTQTGIAEAAVRSRHGSDVSNKMLDRRKSITLPIISSHKGSPIILQTSGYGSSWHKELCENYISEFIQYLQNLGFVPLQLRNERTKDGNEEIPTPTGGLQLVNNMCHAQKSLIGGSLIILELSVMDPYFSVRMYCLEAGQIYPERSKNLQITMNFVEECDKLKASIHLHSFTYDYHLRFIHAYISGSQRFYCRGYHMTSFLEDFARYYQKSPNFAWNSVCQGILITKNLATPAYQLFNHILNNEKLYGMMAKQMIPFVGDNNSDVDSEYVLIETSTKKVSYKDGNEMRRTDDFDICLLIAHDKPTPGDNVDPYTLVLKYFIILTSQRELYPRAVVDKKLGKFRTVATASPIASRKVSTSSVDRSDLSWIDAPKPSSNISSLTSSLKAEDDFEENVAVECSEDNSVENRSEFSDSGNHLLAQSPFGQLLGRNQTSIRQEAVNYLGYFSTNEELMNQIMQEQIEAAKANITKILEMAVIHCRRDSLWKRLVIGIRDNDDGKRRKEDMKELMTLGLNYNEFSELLKLVVIHPLNEIDPRLNQLFNMHITWYQGLAKVLVSKYPDWHRLFVSSNEINQHVVVINSSFQSDMFVVLSIEPQQNKAVKGQATPFDKICGFTALRIVSLNVVYRLRPTPETSSRLIAGSHELIEDFGGEEAGKFYIFAQLKHQY